MPGKPVIWIVDTSVFLNVLDVPQFNQDRVEVLANFESRINNGDTFLLPITSVIETGNHIARINNGNQRQIFAQKFTDQVFASIGGESPWKPLEYPEAEDVKKWLADFPNTAQAGMGLGDHIIKNNGRNNAQSLPLM